MKFMGTVRKHAQYFLQSKTLVVSAFLLLFGGIALGSVIANNQPVVAATCSANDIIKCGVGSKADFAAKYKANTTGDLPAIYAAYGLSASNITSFGASAVEGTTCKDGTVQVNGKTVATGTRSLGRSQKSGDTAKIIGGKTYWEGPNSTAFASNCLNALVLMNGDQFIAAVIKDCANPLKATPVPVPKPQPTPQAACESLTVQELSRTSFRLNAKATASQGGGIKGYDFSVTNKAGNKIAKATVNGDGKSAGASVDVSQAGAYTAKVTVRTSVGDKSGTQCQKPLTVKAAPIAACESLTFAKVDRTTFKLSAKATASNGATISNYDFVVANKAGKQVAHKTVASSAQSASYTAKLTTAGTYSAKVTVKTSVGNKTSTACQKSLTVAPETCKDNPRKPECQPKECLPGIPEGDARCTPVAECVPGIPVGDTRCNPTPPTPTPPVETPPELPATGPVEVVSGVLGFGSITGAGYSWFRSRRNLFMK